MAFKKGHIPWNTGLTESDPRVKKMVAKIKRLGPSQKTIEAIIKANTGRIPWNKGRKSPETSGENNSRWKGGRHITTYGYIQINKPDYPNADSRGRVWEHRYVMEQKLGRLLEKWELIHHKNGNKMDNKPENLEIFTRSEHARLHMDEERRQWSRERMKNVKRDWHGRIVK